MGLKIETVPVNNMGGFEYICPHPGCGKQYYGIRSHHNNRDDHIDSHRDTKNCWICEENEWARVNLRR